MALRNKRISSTKTRDPKGSRVLVFVPPAFRLQRYAIGTKKTPPSRKCEKAVSINIL